MKVKTKNQLFTSSKEWFSLQYPRMWEMEAVDNIPAFFDPLHGHGALQVFSVKLGSLKKITDDMKQFPFLQGKNLSEKMKIFLEHQNIDFSEENLTIYDNKGLFFVPYEYYLQNRFYMACMLQKNDIFLLALYNCEDRPSEEEGLTVGEIIRSIQILF